VEHQGEGREKFGDADFGFTAAAVAAIDTRLVAVADERRALDLLWQL